MALIACPECSAQVSDQAIACPSCGARPPKAARSKSSKAVLYTLLSIPLIILAWASVGSSDPAAREKADARAAISTCWDTQQAKSNSPGDSRFIAGACEKMERDFTTKYGHTP